MRICPREWNGVLFFLPLFVLSLTVLFLYKLTTDDSPNGRYVLLAKRILVFFMGH